MVHGLALAREFGWLDGVTAYYFGNMEEWCDGIAPNSFVEVDPQVRPDFVVIGEPTKMRIYRGHKGRLELKITARGKVLRGVWADYWSSVGRVKPDVAEPKRTKLWRNDFVLRVHE
jgi:hypothetical protein